MLKTSPESHVYERSLVSSAHVDGASRPDWACIHCGQDEPSNYAHRAPAAEEWAIHDYEGFGGLTIHESHGFEEVAELAALLSEHGPAYAAYVGYVGEDYATASGFEDAYAGDWDSEQAYAENYIDDSGMLSEMPEQMRYYFDYEAFARDMFRHDMYSEDNPAGGIFVFHRN